MQNQSNDQKTEAFDSWALVELFGHQKIVGRVTEATLAGGAFLRVDVPAVEENAAFTRFYGPGAVYSMSPITEQVALELVKRHRNEPVNQWDIPKLAERNQVDDSPDDALDYPEG